MSKAASIINKLIAEIAHGPPGLMTSTIMHVIRITVNAEHLHIAYLLGHLGCQLNGLDHQSEAETLHRRALCIGTKILGRDHPELADAMEWLAYSLYRQGNFKEAVLLCMSAAILIQCSFGPLHPILANCYSNLATIVEAMGLIMHGNNLRLKANGIIMLAWYPWVANSTKAADAPHRPEQQQKETMRDDDEKRNESSHPHTKLSNKDCTDERVQKVVVKMAMNETGLLNGGLCEAVKVEIKTETCELINGKICRNDGKVALEAGNPAIRDDCDGRKC